MALLYERLTQTRHLDPVHVIEHMVEPISTCSRSHLTHTRSNGIDIIPAPFNPLSIHPANMLVVVQGIVRLTRLDMCWEMKFWHHKSKPCFAWAPKVELFLVEIKARVELYGPLACDVVGKKNVFELVVAKGRADEVVHIDVSNVRVKLLQRMLIQLAHLSPF